MSHPVTEERPTAHGDALNGLRAAIAERFLEEVAALVAPLRPRP